MIELASSVVIPAPPEVQAVAIPVMRRYGGSSLRPHITVMFPFVPYDQLEAASRKMYELAPEIAPFEVTLDDYGKFPGVIYMNPVNPEPIKSVFRKLLEVFPDYLPYEGQYGEDIEPHLTVAHVEDGEIAPETELPDYEPITFNVDRLHLWYGANDRDLPWVTYDVIPLRG